MKSLSDHGHTPQTWWQAQIALLREHESSLKAHDACFVQTLALDFPEPSPAQLSRLGRIAARLDRRRYA